MQNSILVQNGTLEYLCIDLWSPFQNAISFFQPSFNTIMAMNPVIRLCVWIVIPLVKFIFHLLLCNLLSFIIHEIHGTDLDMVLYFPLIHLQSPSNTLSFQFAIHNNYVRQITSDYRNTKTDTVILFRMQKEHYHLNRLKITKAQVPKTTHLEKNMFAAKCAITHNARLP